MGFCRISKCNLRNTNHESCDKITIPVPEHTVVWEAIQGSSVECEASVESRKVHALFFFSDIHLHWFDFMIFPTLFILIYTSCIEQNFFTKYHKGSVMMLNSYLNHHNSVHLSIETVKIGTLLVPI